MMNVHSYEHSHEHAPSTDQLNELAAVALGTARHLGKIISPSFADGKARFFRSEVGLGDIDSGAEFKRHILGFVVARNAIRLNEVDDFMNNHDAMPTWQFRIKDTYFCDSQGNRGMRDEYHFAWNKDHVFKSEKETTLLPTPTMNLTMKELSNWLANNTVDTDMLAEEMSICQLGADEFYDISDKMKQHFEALKIR